MAARGEPSDVFFAYASAPPLVAECMRTTADSLAQRSIDARTWQQLPIEGRLLID